MKSIFKSTLYFSLSMVAVGLASRVLFGGSISWKFILSSFVAGLFTGFIFVVAMRWTVKRLLRKIVILLEDDEKMLKEGGANHFRGVEGVGGKLVLTDKRLIFKSHKFNVQNHQEAYALDQIDKVSKTKTLKLIPNGLTIDLRDNRTERFVVEGADEWQEVLDHRISRIANLAI